jgi:nicotinamidase-related amidase
MIYPLQGKPVALLVVDVQQEYFDPEGPAFVPDGAKALPRILDLIAGFRAHDLPVVFIRHAHRPDGSDLGRMGDFLPPDEEDSFVEGTPRVAFVDELPVTEDDLVVTKRRYSSFAGTDLAPILRTLGVTTVVVTGLMTSFCCETTARDASTLDYETLFVIDAVAGPDLVGPDGEPVPSATVTRSTATALANGFAEVVEAADVLDRLG